MALAAGLKERKLHLSDSGLLEKCQDLVNGFDVQVDDVLDALEAVCPGGNITANDITKARTALAKKHRPSTGLPRGGAGSPTLLSGAKRPASEMSGGGAGGAGSSTSPTGTRPSSPNSYSPQGPGAKPSTDNPALYSNRKNQGELIESYGASTSNLGTGSAFTKATLSELQAKGFRTKELVQKKLSGTAPTASLVRQEYSVATPLPVVCASLTAYASVTGMQVVGGLPQRRVLESTKSVTFSAAHAASYAPPAAPPAASSTSSSSSSSSDAPASPPQAISPSQVSPAGSPAHAAVDIASIPRENLLAAAAGLAAPSVAAAAAAASSSSSGMDVDDSSSSGAGADVPCLTVPFEDRSLTKPYRFMFTTQKEKSENLEGRLQELTDAIISGAYDPLLAELLCPVGTPSQEPIVYVGRICTNSDGGTLDGRINASSVLLEGSASEAALTSTYRVHLDLSDLPGWAIFPGQVVAVKGTNPLGDKMRVQALYHGIPAPPAALPVANREAIAAAAAEKGAGPMRVWAVSGPFCLQHELDYTPLEDMFAEVVAAAEKNEGPDVLILMGPFVDADHPKIRSGDMTYDAGEQGGGLVVLSVEDLWSARFLPCLEDNLALPSLADLHVVLIPAFNDANCMPVYPQAPIGAEKFDVIENENVRRRIHSVANPSTFVVGDVVFAATSCDVISNFNRDDSTNIPRVEHPGAGPKTDKLPRMAQHVLEQRCFFPMFPAPGMGGPLPSESSGFNPENAAVPIELSQLWSLSLPVSPDVLILPSRLRGFARAMGQTLAINPGNLCRGNLAGTYAKITVQRPSKDVIKKHSFTALPGDSKSTVPAAGELYCNSGILDRARVEVVRL